MAINDYLERRKNEKWKKTTTFTEQVWFQHLSRTIAALLLLALLMTLVSACETLQYSAVNPSWTGETEALIVANTITHQSRYRKRYVYTFQYSVNGQVYRGTEAQKREAMSSEYLETVNIIYDEDNPEKFVVAPDDAKKLYSKSPEVLLWVGSFGLAYIITVLQKKAKERKTEKIRQEKLRRKKLKESSDDSSNLLS